MLVQNLELDIETGEFVCILGTNGVGKTLTLHTLAGLREGRTQSVRVGGEPLDALPRKELAKRLGLLLQIQEDAFPQTVLDTALMGLYPHLKHWQWPGREEYACAHHALQVFDLAGLESRSVMTLSGGERERLALATLQVQNPLIWLLDEPMNHLDPHHQHTVMEHLKSVSKTGRIVISTMHNPNHALHYADKVLMLYGQGEWEYGPAAELLQPSRLERIYQTPFTFYQSNAEDGKRTLLAPR